MAEESNKSFDEVFEPQLTSKDPNERKMARRLRVERRWEAIKKNTNAEIKEDVVEHNSPIEQQAQKSTELLEKYVHEADEYITNIRVANDTREVDRRENEGIAV